MSVCVCTFVFVHGLRAGPRVRTVHVWLSATMAGCAVIFFDMLPESSPTEIEAHDNDSLGEGSDCDEVFCTG